MKNAISLQCHYNVITLYIQYQYISSSGSSSRSSSDVIYTICTKNHYKIVHLYKFQKFLDFVLTKFLFLGIISTTTETERKTHIYPYLLHMISKNQQKSNSTKQGNQICTVCTNLKKLEKTT